MGRGGVTDAELLDVLAAAQRAGFLGARPVGEVVAHARCFVAALDPVRGAVIDLGSGAGIPGLVIALDRPDLDVTLLDRRTKRTDFLERMVRRLGWQDEVAVVAMDVDELGDGRRGTFDAVTARGFGPPDRTLRAAARLGRPGGRIVVSEPPGAVDRGARWPTDLLRSVDVVRVPQGSRVAVFERRGCST